MLPLNIDECRVGYDADDARLEWLGKYAGNDYGDRGDAVYGDGKGLGSSRTGGTPAGRYPANVVLSDDPEVHDAFAAFGERGGGAAGKPTRKRNGGVYAQDAYTQEKMVRSTVEHRDAGTAARFFYCSKASKAERIAAADGTKHPTQKPLALLSWLVKLVCPPGGTVLDPFLGSGTTAVACVAEGRRWVGIEADAKHCEIIRKRLAEAEEACAAERAPARRGQGSILDVLDPEPQEATA